MQEIAPKNSMIIWKNQYLFLSLQPIFHSKYFNSKNSK